MRRVRHLVYTDYIVPVRQKAGRGLLLSNCTIKLERTWHERHRKLPVANVFAKFNADLMNGVQFIANLSKDNAAIQSIVHFANLYRVDEASWATTLIAPVTFTLGDDGYHTAYVDQATLGNDNELTGRETYMLDIKLVRVRKYYGAKVWFNHIGCFDSINLLRQRVEGLKILKGDY